MTKRLVAAAFLLLGPVALAAGPASAQVGETLYMGPGVNTPAIPASGGGAPVGGVLAASGTSAVPTQVLASQTRGAVAATAQAPVQGLAFTGADIVTLLAIGLSLTAVGVVLTRKARAHSVPGA